MTLQVTLNRFMQTYGAMLGIINVPGISTPLYTLEDNWLNNKPMVSCIPPGTYKAMPHGWAENSAVKFKKVWELTPVPNRSAILIHAGNTHADTHGCILVGMGLQVNYGTKTAMITNSQIAVNLLRETIGNKSFSIKINSIEG